MKLQRNSFIFIDTNMISRVLLALFWVDIILVSALDDYTRADFPEGFVFGAGTSAYQVEGAVFEDGRTPSIWDTFNHAGYMHGANGDQACDHYHKYKEDVKLMAEIGLEAYRFSISWSRLIPNGRGPVNPKGLEFYNNLINELIARGIQPHVVLCHMDTPQALEDEYGGWLSRKIVKDFIAYADVCFKEFGDRVKYWTPVNEANIYAVGGYDNGITPPGRCSPPYGYRACTEGNSTTEVYIVGHNLVLAHSYVMKLYKKKYKEKQHGFVGINVYASWQFPYTNSKEDAIATQRSIDFYIGWLVEPFVFGDYPEIVRKNAGTKIPAFTLYEKKLVKGSFDFIGVNHYLIFYVKDCPACLEIQSRNFNADMAVTLEFQPSEESPVQNVYTGRGLYEVLDYFKRAYGNPPVYIHENGVKEVRNGTLCDVSRAKSIHDYVGSVLDAIRNGSNTRGYILWTLMDGFELLDAYDSAYGLIYVDLDDKQFRRYPKVSAHCYSNFLKGGGRIWPCEMTEVKDNRLVPSTTVASH